MTATATDNEAILPVRQGNAEPCRARGTPRKTPVFAEPALVPEQDP